LPYLSDGNGERSARATARTAIAGTGFITTKPLATTVFAGFSDERQLVSFGLAQWNAKDPILKERLLVLPNSEAIMAKTYRNTTSISTAPRLIRI
jgi:hypothetical protein